MRRDGDYYRTIIRYGKRSVRKRRSQAQSNDQGLWLVNIALNHKRWRHWPHETVRLSSELNVAKFYFTIAMKGWLSVNSCGSVTLGSLHLKSHHSLDNGGGKPAGPTLRKPESASEQGSHRRRADCFALFESGSLRRNHSGFYKRPCIVSIQ